MTLPPGGVRKVTARIGRRGGTLITLGLLQIIAGMSFLSASTPKNYFDFLPITSHVPIGVWGCVWIATGSMAVLSSLWKTGKDAWGFQFCYPLFALWGIDTTISTVLGDYPLGLLRGAFSSVLYFALMGLVFSVSGMDGTATIRQAMERGDTNGNL